MTGAQAHLGDGIAAPYIDVDPHFTLGPVLPAPVDGNEGELSLVGPRPPIPTEVARYEPAERRRLSMRPGLTCFWQVSGRNSIGFDDWVKLDLEYIDQWSPWLDMGILIRTIPAVLSGRGAS